MSTDNKNIYYPPGGVLIWIIIFLEILTFTMAIGAFLYQKGGAYEAFTASQALLNPTFGMINTLVLISGGFFMATALHQLKQNDNAQSLWWIRAAIAMGILFLGIKGYEYSEKIAHGLTIDYDSFFTFYWLLTAFHFIHIIVALMILIFLSFGIAKGSYSASDYEDVEAGAAFWHMCDLIWLFLFPVLYLMN